MAKIFLVDDEEYIRQLYSEELVEEGHEVVTAASGHDLLRGIALLQPEVVLLDIRLVDYDGLELLQDIRNHHHELPVILCTAYDTYKYDPKAMAADYYVIKSFDLSELKMAVTRAIKEGRVPMQLAAG
ncbi:MAG: response regulator [Deltaproteobacteria bacterium]|nr:MAG: response regulator [Deltaproteobacteria bacterium]